MKLLRISLVVVVLTFFAVVGVSADGGPIQTHRLFVPLQLKHDNARLSVLLKLSEPMDVRDAVELARAFDASSVQLILNVQLDNGQQYTAGYVVAADVDLTMVSRVVEEQTLQAIDTIKAEQLFQQENGLFPEGLLIEPFGDLRGIKVGSVKMSISKDVLVQLKNLGRVDLLMQPNLSGRQSSDRVGTTSLTGGAWWPNYEYAAIRDSHNGYGSIYQAMRWNQRRINNLAWNEAYEPDIVFRKGQFFKGGGWFTYYGMVYWMTTFPKGYIDTPLLDGNGHVVYTIGEFSPRTLRPGTIYVTYIVARRGNSFSEANVVVRAQKPKKPWWCGHSVYLSGYCVGLNTRQTKNHELFRMTVPGRRWRWR